MLFPKNRDFSDAGFIARTCCTEVQSACLIPAMQKCVVLCFLVCIVCLVVLLHLYWTHSWILMELDRVRQERSNYHCSCSGVQMTLACGKNRGKRDVNSQKIPRQRRQKQRTFLQLVPSSTQSYDEQDMTVLIWAVGRSQGAGLKVSGDSITVVTEGPYFIYSQVLYKDPTWLMGHVITKRLRSAETKLMKCLKSMPSNVSEPYNTCYTAGVHFLESGSVLELSVPRRSADLVLSAQATFMGIFSI
ncbi:tumor necrosis factor ligand superfamily member 13 isoform X2 [Trichomycterus rosablanca]|uniref:tumor necrosis factor ligand superfamily member 13 isoform X2 n=1 Tax=Trichomycterus rosablanca TaxID=2290929 RepID=UPI002F34F984